MQTRVIATSFFSKLKPSITKTTRYDQVWTRLLSSSTGSTADPSVHSTDDPMGPNSAIHSPEEAYKGMEESGRQRDPTPVKDKDPFVTSEAPLSSSPQLKSSVADQPIKPNTQQKRSNVTISCTGLDAWGEEKNDGGMDRREMRKQQEEDDKEYFSHRKASPLSEIEVADTRKPVTQATDGSDIGYDAGGGGVIMFREEQRVGAEETMRRATEMWREMAARGDPLSPHGRVLRTLRGEDW
ncbi:mRNA export factor like [Heracleum sosnowskyi]|uniref:mRNA export factor like n=1 Tax=Heracleum sosnowskyi TaxID=360622 RepID=A0AAD8IJI6_9APIA|nr:mRNA export factor like [Heracleum sosnowskyi]